MIKCFVPFYPVMYEVVKKINAFPKKLRTQTNTRTTTELQHMLKCKPILSDCNLSVDMMA